jgi:Raf kinase inhibitor-like YbhB/YbcL family protein
MNTSLTSFLSCLIMVLTGCAGPSPASAPASEVVFSLTSSAFGGGDRIPTKYTADGVDLSPPLQWSNLPEGTVTLAMICDDPDVSRRSSWVHWIIYDIPALAPGLPMGIERSPKLSHPLSAKQGRTSWRRDNIGWQGPSPPPGTGDHHYTFTLYALAGPTGLPAGVDRVALKKAMKGKVIQKATLIGIYSRDEQ